jgi:hypothetical protein
MAKTAIISESQRRKAKEPGNGAAKAKLAKAKAGSWQAIKQYQWTGAGVLLSAATSCAARHQRRGKTARRAANHRCLFSARAGVRSKAWAAWQTMAAANRKRAVMIRQQ